MTTLSAASGSMPSATTSAPRVSRYAAFPGFWDLLHPFLGILFYLRWRRERHERFCGKIGVRKAVFVIQYGESSGTALLAYARSVASDQVNLRIRVECQLLYSC